MTGWYDGWVCDGVEIDDGFAMKELYVFRGAGIVSGFETLLSVRFSAGGMVTLLVFCFVGRDIDRCSGLEDGGSLDFAAYHIRTFVGWKFNVVLL